MVNDPASTLLLQSMLALSVLCVRRVCVSTLYTERERDVFTLERDITIMIYRYILCTQSIQQSRALFTMIYTLCCKREKKETHTVKRT
jgi:hypothetical protein